MFFFLFFLLFIHYFSLFLLPFLFIVYFCMYVFFSFNATILVNKGVYIFYRTNSVLIFASLVRYSLLQFHA